MSTWVGAIVETAGRPDFWDVARKHGIEATTQEIPKHALIDCNVAFTVPFRLAEEMSRDLGTMAIGFTVQTTVDVHELRAFDKGTAIRSLLYGGEDGWVQVEGTPQPWERAYFFDEEDSIPSDDNGLWPDMLWDDMSEHDVARYQTARRTGDASKVLDLMHPSSTAPMHRVCDSFELRPDRPHGQWKKRSFLSRLLSR